MGLTQTKAAMKAHVSVATWRRWEEDPTSVSERSRKRCESVIGVAHSRAARVSRKALQDEARQLEAVWGSAKVLTPRQAHHVATTLSVWGDGDLPFWVASREEPLTEVGPFYYFDLRVMIRIDENRAFVQAVAERSRSLARDIVEGTFPSARSGPFIDDVLIAAALVASEDVQRGNPEAADHITARVAGPGEDRDDASHVLDSDWDLVPGLLDDLLDDAWQVPVVGGPRLPALLEDRHPFTWLDESA